MQYPTKSKITLPAAPSRAPLALDAPVEQAARTSFRGSAADTLTIGTQQHKVPRLTDAVLTTDVATLYWMALLRDVPFEQMPQNMASQAAHQSLHQLQQVQGVPTPAPHLHLQNPALSTTPNALFVSQFLYRNSALSERLSIEPKQVSAHPGTDFIPEGSQWQDQNTSKKALQYAPNLYDEGRQRYIRTPRDLAHFICLGEPLRLFLHAAQLLIDMEAPVAAGLKTATQAQPARHVLKLLTLLAGRAMESVILMPNRVSPLVLSRVINLQLTRGGQSPIHNALYAQKELLLATTFRNYVLQNGATWISTRDALPETLWQQINNSTVNLARRVSKGQLLNQSEISQQLAVPAVCHDLGLAEVDFEPAMQCRQSTMTLPFEPGLRARPAQPFNFRLSQALPSGLKLFKHHPAEQSVVAGACATLLKAWFDTGVQIADPAVPSADGRKLEVLKGQKPVTIGQELNKLAGNIASAYNWAGLAWSWDTQRGLRLGEQVAIGLLHQQKKSMGSSTSFRFQGFDGNTVLV